MKVRDLIRELQKIEGDREVLVGFPSGEPSEDEEGDGNYEVSPLLPDVSTDVIDDQLVCIIFADPEFEDEEDEEFEDEAANENDN